MQASQSTIPELYQRFLECNGDVCTDTRKINKGSMFFALKGGNFNANEFASKALENGCRYAVVDQEKFAVEPRIILVKDALWTLQALANHHRRQFTFPFLAITGSNAKTTHKELINAVLSRKYKTLATEGNLNNHIGVPLTLLKVRKEHDYAIIEMGANHQGEIEALCKIAEPDYGLITNIGKAHLEGFGGIEGVKKGKSELYRYLRSVHGKAFINGDDDILHDLAMDNDKISYGCKKLYDVIGKDVSDSEKVSFKFTNRYGEKDWKKLPTVRTQIVGSYNFINCLAAAAVGHYFHLQDEQIKEALENYVPNMNRSQLVRTPHNTLLLDAYNANPNSMKAAIENFAKFPAEKKLVLLGDMFELGEHSKEEHEAVISLLTSLAFKQVILVGSEFNQCSEGKEYPRFKTTSECREHLKNLQLKDTTILIKGSRGMKMETLQEAL